MSSFKISNKFGMKKNTDNGDNSENSARSVIDKILKEVETSPYKQLIICTSTGWLTGLLAMKIGKTVAFALGAGIILLEIANQKGYIKVNWNKINDRQFDKMSGKAKKEITGQKSNWIDTVYTYAYFNNSLTAGFIGGFLVSLASH